MNSPPCCPADPLLRPLHYSHLPPPSLLDASQRILDQACPPSLREILGAYKFSKGQDGDCQVLLAVLNAKSAEDQRLAAEAKLHAAMLKFERTTRTQSLSPRSASSSPRSSSSLSSSPRSHPYHRPQPSHGRLDTDAYDRVKSRSSHPHSHSHPRHAYSRTPYERPIHTQRSQSRSPAISQTPAQYAQDILVSTYSSPTNSPSVREAMAIGSLLSPEEGDEKQLTS